MSRDRFRPALQALEAREVPALAVAYDGASLAVTGTPDVPLAPVRIQGDGGGNFAVTNGPANFGTFHVTRDIRVRLAEFDTSVFVVLAGDHVAGGVLIDVGAGDVNPATRGQVVLGNVDGAARIDGDVTFRGGSGEERWRVAATTDETIDIGGGIRVLGRPVTAPIEDDFQLDPGARVGGDVTTSRITYTTIQGTVDGDVTANAADSPGGIGFRVTGTVRGDVTATGGATAAGYFSLVQTTGTIDGDVTVRITDRGSSIGLGGVIGGDVRLTLADTGSPSRYHLVNAVGQIDGDTTVRSAGSLYTSLSGEFAGDVTVSATGPDSVGGVDGLIHGDFRFVAGPATNTDYQIVGAVGGSAVIDLGGSADTFAMLSLIGFDLYPGHETVGGSLTVRSHSGNTSVRVDDHVSFPDETGTEVTVGFPATIGGDLKVDLGDGANTFVFDGASGSTLGGKLTYTGGSGTDSVTILGENTFAAKIRTGAGADTVAFAPDASVASADIDFGDGTDTWTPPAVIRFPLKLKNL